METIKKYLKTCGVLNLIVMGVTLLSSLYVLLIEHRLISEYVQTLQGDDKLGAGLGICFLLVFLLIAAVVMFAFALTEMIIGLILLMNAKKDEFNRTPIGGVISGVVAMLLSGAGFAFYCLFSFDTAGFSVGSRILYAGGLLICVGCAIASIVMAALIRNEERSLREEPLKRVGMGKDEFFY